MKIDFVNDKVQQYFDDSNYNLMIKQIGIEKAKTVKKHIDRLKSSVSFQSFLMLGLGKPHSLNGNLDGNYAVSVSGNVRLIIQPDCKDRTPESLKRCSVVIVKGIGDYHGGKIEWFIP